jgi:hypothetical protein
MHGLSLGLGFFNGAKREAKIDSIMNNRLKSFQLILV